MWWCVVACLAVARAQVCASCELKDVTCKFVLQLTLIFCIFFKLFDAF